MLVVDASAVVELLLSTPVGAQVAARLGPDHTLHAPDLLGVEVVSVLRRLHRLDQLAAADSDRALVDLRALGIASYEHEPLLGRALALRDSLTAYDATYVALAEALGAPLLTCDRKLAGSSGHGADVVLVGGGRASGAAGLRGRGGRSEGTGGDLGLEAGQE